jgi:hypothetical protein
MVIGKPAKSSYVIEIHVFMLKELFYTKKNFFQNWRFILVKQFFLFFFKIAYFILFLMTYINLN